MKKASEIGDIGTMLMTMYELFVDYPLTELRYETPFQCLLAVMLSAQTTDIQVNKVTDVLFKKIKTPADLVAMGEETFGEHIRTVGLWKGKMRHGVAMARMLESRDLTPALSSKERESVGDAVGAQYFASSAGDARIRARDAREVYETWWYIIPDTIDEMVKLPGVGIKTAKVVLYLLYGQRRVAVDTHVHRVMNRLWVVQTKHPEQTSKVLEDVIPEELKDVAHRSIIYFGRYLCKAKKPECERCPLWERCGWEGKKERG